MLSKYASIIDYNPLPLRPGGAGPGGPWPRRRGERGPGGRGPGGGEERGPGDRGPMLAVFVLVFDVFFVF